MGTREVTTDVDLCEGGERTAFTGCSRTQPYDAWRPQVFRSSDYHFNPGRLSAHAIYMRYKGSRGLILDSRIGGSLDLAFPRVASLIMKGGASESSVSLPSSNPWPTISSLPPFVLHLLNSRRLS